MTTRADHPAVAQALDVLRIEEEAIAALRTRIGQAFTDAVQRIVDCRGRVVVTGMGKAGIIGQKLSATLASTGTPSLWLHPAEAFHGDLGRVTRGDVVICLSNSGETEEITRLLPLIKRLGAALVAFTGKLDSTLATHSDLVLDVGIEAEACPLGLAPTASTTAMLAMGDALAMAVSSAKGFKLEDFAARHPGGQLGKQLLMTVADLMRRGEAHPVVLETALVKEALLAITAARAGSVSVVDEAGCLVGIFTDGDLRRHIEERPDIITAAVRDVMTRHPKTVRSDKLVAEAVAVLQRHRIDELPVVDDAGRPVGLLDVQDALRTGLL